MRGEPYELDPETIERLISASTTDLGADLAPLADLLAAARAPAYPDELTGMDAALAAVRQGRSTGVPAARDTRRLTGILSPKAVAVALAAAALGGGAVAVAATGSLPAPHTPDGSARTTSVAPPNTTPAATPNVLRTAGNPSPRTTHQALLGMCRVYTASGAKAIPRPLVSAAGGRNKVPAFCATLPAARPRAKTKGAAEDTTGRGAPKTLRATPSPTRTKPQRGNTR